MINENLLKEAIVSQKKAFIQKKDLFSRDILKDFYAKYGGLKEAIVITGIRRCGKSSLLRLVWQEIKARQKFSDEQFLYLNFEDERLVGFSREDFSGLLEAFYQLNSPDKREKVFLFLDEIQNVPHWEKWINRLQEESGYKIFITGSNATLLSSELATALTGRSVSVELQPLSFREFYVHFKREALNRKSFYDIDQRAKIKKALEEYLLSGGMPEYIKTGSEELIQEYFRDIISRDIVNRYNIKYKQGIRELAHLLLSNLGQIQSLKKISRHIEIKNIGTVKNYLRYFEDSFLFFHVPLFSFSYKKQIYNPDKIYVSDIAFFNIAAFKSSQNRGAVFENIVFSFLRKEKYNEIFYYKTERNFEVDFVVKQKNKVGQLIQVCADISSNETAQRERRALLEAMEELKVKRGIIVNDSLEKTEEEGGKTIEYIPLWKWLLEGDL